jgi:hypothetical protein
VAGAASRRLKVQRELVFGIWCFVFGGLVLREMSSKLKGERERGRECKAAAGERIMIFKIVVKN